MRGEKVVDNVSLDASTQLKFSEEITKNNLWQHLAQNSAAIAHEVRNPLQTLQALLTSLDRNHSIEKGYVSMIREELTRADQLLTDFLNLFHEGPPDFVSRNLNDICAKVVALMQSSAMMRGVELVGQYEPFLPLVLCDQSKIKQILLNLISNALDASGRGTKIVVSTYRDGDCVCLSVKDRGCGIPEDVRPLIFEPFFTDKPYGTGMGLFLCRQLAEEHGGQLRLLDNGEPGTEMVLYLPI